MIYGEGDDKLGDAGILTHIMNTEELSDAMIELARDPEKRQKMGEIGYERCRRKYRLEHMQDIYRELYGRVMLDGRTK